MARSRDERSAVRASLERFRRQVRERARVQAVTDTFLRSLAGAARLHPQARAGRHDVEIISDIPYTDTGRADHHLDVYRPMGYTGPRPVVLYVHGGGFTQLSKDTHWVMALAYARYGYLVFNISYRLAPRHPYPAALVDTLAAYRWVVDHAASYGGDLDQLIVAGESAGANLVSALTIATCFERPEPWAKQAFDIGVVPKVAVPACGIFQVSDAGRFARRRRLPWFVRKIVEEVSSAYLRGAEHHPEGRTDLADPLLVLESAAQPVRPLPAFFLPVGTRDPLLDDTRRMRRALGSRGVPVRAIYYPGEIHAFHALVFRQRARDCWADIFAFVDQQLRAGRRHASITDESAA